MEKTKFKHTTLGEWEVEHVIKQNGDAYYKVGIELGTSICNITTRNSEQARANAKLIAAAPELLKALQKAQAHLEYCGWGDSWERECANEDKLPAKIQTAIDKAL